MSRTRRDILDTEAMLSRLEDALHKACTGDSGDCRADAESLRRISMTLHRWHELECGTDVGSIGRGCNGNPFWRPARADYGPNGEGRLVPVPDREKGALARLAKIAKRYPSLAFYVQGDPRGCALYVLRPGDVPEGKRADSFYSRGLAVHQ
jgi:hypothetical protein